MILIYESNANLQITNNSHVPFRIERAAARSGFSHTGFTPLENFTEKSFYQRERNQKFLTGFTLLETLIAISVMIVGIVGIYALVPKIISVTSINTDRFIASQLAREGMELVRNIRDTNWLQGENWDTGLTICQPANNKFCEAEYDDYSLASYDKDTHPGNYLRINNEGFYNYATGTKTKFKRIIEIIPETNVLKVEVKVSWGGEGSPLQVKENLYKWLR